MTKRQLDAAYWALRVGLGGTAFLAGLDKFTDVLADWDQYLSPVVEERSPVSASTFMRGVGVVEMIVGATILSGRTKLGGYVAGAWLLGIAANLVTGQDYYDIAVRDVNMAIGAFTLAQLDERRVAWAAQREFDDELVERAA
jgi:uncharacterized membrane protein YphA (DoxX/SURF4 family)